MIERLLYRLWLWLGDRYGFQMRKVFYDPASIRVLKQNLQFVQFIEPRPLPNFEK